jgi:hypothetical protein
MDLLNLVFILFSLIAIGLLCFYFYRLAQHDKEDWLRKEVEEAVKEKDAEEWLDHSFVPDVLHFIKLKPKIIIKYTFFALLAGVFLWSYAIGGLNTAVENAFLACILYISILLYINAEPRLFDYAKNHLPRKLRHSFDNDWIRAYVFFLLPAGIIDYFISQPFSFLSFLFIYSALFLSLVAATRMSTDIGKEEDKHRKKVVKKLLEEK